VTGSQFSSMPLNDTLAVNQTFATVSAATSSGLTATIPPGAASGHLTVITVGGQAVSTADLFVPPAPYAAGDVEFTGRTTVGSTQTIPTIDANKIGLLLFDGTAGQRVSIGRSGFNCVTTTSVVYKPDGTTLSGSCSGPFMDTMTLPVDGTYEILIASNSGAISGSYTLYNVPADIAGTISTGGTPVTVTTTVPGQNAVLTFSGTAGTRISLDQSGFNCFSSHTTIRNPDSTTLATSCGGYFIDPQTLPQTGTYSITIDPVDDSTGNTTLTLYNVPADLSGSLTSGTATTVTTTVPGQNGRYTFAGTVGQRVSLDQSGYNCFTDQTSILKPDGTSLASTCGGTFIDVQTLPIAGTYTVLVDPQGNTTGSTTITYYSVPADATAIATVGGSGVTLTMGTPGQNGQVTFSGTASQLIAVTLSGATVTGNGPPAFCCSMQVSILNPDGSALVSPTSEGTSGGTINAQLGAAGTYTIVVDPQNDDTGSATLTITQRSSWLPQLTAVGPLLAGLAPVSAPQAAGGQILSGIEPLGVWLRDTAASAAATATASPTPSATASSTPTPTPQPTASATATSTSTPTATPTPATTGTPTPTPAARSTPTPAATPQAARTPRPGPEDEGDEWIPNRQNLMGDWHSQRGRSGAQALPPLKGPPGVTALAGQALTLSGHPLDAVTLQVGNKKTQSDESGRFLLTDLPAGHQVLLIDGSTADNHGHHYGLYEDGVDLVAGTTTALDYTIWMTRLDEKDAVTIPSPTTADTVVTTPRIPGLELHIPAGQTITDHAGKPVTRLSITAIPVDRPPFPLPKGVEVPVYFTIQPGSAYIAPQGARLIYPNYTHQAPGTQMQFWDYDPDVKGWFVYGSGTVTADGKQVVPDPGVLIYEFTGAMITVPGWSPPPPFGPFCIPFTGLCNDGDPVDLSSGLFVMNKIDLALPGPLPIALTRTYRQRDPVSRPFGIGATHPYDMHLWSANQYQEADLILPDGARIHYVRTSPGTGFVDAVFQNNTTPGPFYQSTMSWNGNGWNLVRKDGTVYVFGDTAPLQAIRDRNGNTITIQHDSGQTGNVTRVSNSNGRWIAFTYDTSNRITQIRDNIGRTVGYTYDAGGRLWTTTDPAGGVTTYSYNSNNDLMTIKDARGITYLSNQYDANDRVSQQTQADNSIYQFVYTLNGSGQVTRTTVTDPRANIRDVTFNTSGYMLSDTRAEGKTEQQTTTYNLQAGTNLQVSVTDSLNRTTNYTYDTLGNLSSKTQLSGTPNAVTTTYSYDPKYSQITAITDPLNHVTTFAYDGSGNLTSVTDPLGHTTGMTYNGPGQPVTVTDPLGNITHYTYRFGDLIAVTDPLGNATTRLIDAGGRQLSSNDPLDRVTQYTYNALDQVTEVTNALGATTVLAYDPNGNLTGVTDARHNSTAFTFDNFDRMATRQDPLLRTEGWQYDGIGNLTQYTDRKSQSTTTTYDALNRPAQVTYQGGATVGYTFDAGNRLSGLSDSQSGSLTHTYDGLNRLTAETTPQGTVSYTYDNANRRATMTVPGQAPVTYVYDNADRLTGITQGSQTVVIAYDNADRRTSVTLPNGVAVIYGYDIASRLTSLTYTQGSTTLGTLTYAYDADGQRVGVSGSFARTGLPAAVTSATYDANNALTQWAGSTLTYDANGNLTGDGTNNYTWDTRNRLTSIGGGVTASFGYDPLGRRAQKSVGGTTTSYLYDLLNVVQEQSGGAPTANLLTGLQIDEIFSRTASDGTRDFLRDGLGSTLALTDTGAAVQTTYTYDPFGNPTSTGSPSTNPFQFTGRENDGTGLEYFRARYYSPSTDRFISQDPLMCGVTHTVAVQALIRDPQFLDGYAYVDDSPVTYSDPTGLQKDCNYYNQICSKVSPFDYFVYFYYCNLAPFVCQHGSTQPGASCIRQCLKDGDKTVCSHIFWGRKSPVDTVVCTELGAHFACGVYCWKHTGDFPITFGQ